MIAGSTASRVLVLAAFAGLLPQPAAGNGIDAADLDRSVPACEDFYQYANGGWLARNPVPPAYSSWSTFNEIEDRSNARLLRMAGEAAASREAPEGSPEWLVGRFYQSAIDVDQVNALGFAPIQSQLDAIAAIDSRAGLIAVVRQLQADGIPVLFNLVAQPDLKDPTRVIAYALQGGLGLPNRDFYLRRDAESRRQQDEYRKHIGRLLAMLGFGKWPSRMAAGRIVDLEERLAQAHLSPEALRDPALSYNLVDVAAANRATPGMDWRAHLDAVGLRQATEFSLSHPAYFAAMAQELAEAPLSTWRSYLRWQVLRWSAPFLDSTVASEHFHFYGGILRGQRQQRPREVRAIEQINLRLGEPLGRMYVERYFRPEAKTRVLVLVERLRDAMRQRLEHLPWLGERSREEALRKLSGFRAKIGYPDRWTDYSGLRLEPDRLLQNVRAIERFRMAREFARVGQPVDKDQWYVAPQQVNAYYNPLMNELVFPAGVLQPPIFDGDADDALNFGAIGAVIGHELMHAFDDAGSRFDAEGRLREWWIPPEREEFERRAARLVAQADEFRVAGELRLNGRVGLGENIADLGGVILAHAAFVATLDDDTPVIDDFTPQQRFFLGWARVWRRNWTPEALRLHVQTGPHSPGDFRVNGPLANMPEFEAAFGCKPGDPMVRAGELKALIW